MSQISIITDWSELDLFGHVNNVSFFKYIQSARVNFCELAGLDTIGVNKKTSFIVASTSCTFKKPLLYRETIEINSRCTKVNTSSFEITHTVTNKNSEIVAIGTDVLVVYNYMENAKITITEELKNLIQRL